jgi:hypothetical protein
MSQLGMLPPGLLQQLVMGAQQVPPTSPPQMTMGAQPAPPTSPPYMAGLQGMALGSLFAQTPAGQAGGAPAPAQGPGAAQPPLTMNGDILPVGKTMAQHLQEGPFYGAPQPFYGAPQPFYSQGQPNSMAMQRTPPSVDDLARKLRDAQPLGMSTQDMQMMAAHPEMFGRQNLAEMIGANRQANPTEQAMQIANQQGQEDRLRTLGMGNLEVARQAEARQLQHGNRELGIREAQMSPAYLQKAAILDIVKNNPTLSPAALKFASSNVQDALTPESPTGGPPPAPGMPTEGALEKLSYKPGAAGQFTGDRENVKAYLWKLQNNGIDVEKNFPQIAQYIKTKMPNGEQDLRDAARGSQYDWRNMGLGHIFHELLNRDYSGRNDFTPEQHGGSALQNLLKRNPSAEATIFPERYRQ